VTTLVLWHLSVTGLLAGALGLVVLAQSLSDGLRRVRRSPRVAPSVAPQARPVVEPRTVRTAARTVQEQAPAMATAAGAH
jgi:hypothetical protein